MRLIRPPLLAAALLAVAAAACTKVQPPPAVAPDAGVSMDKIDTSDPKQLMAAVDQMASQLKDRPKNFEVLAALGNLYYENARYLDAVDAYRQALEKSAPLEAKERALVKKDTRPAKELPLECRRTTSYGLEQIEPVVDKLEKSDPPKALRCAQEVLGLALTARARRANALYLIGNPDQALEEHEKVLAREPDYPESLFFVGAILLEKGRMDPAAKAKGKATWERLIKVAPDHPRAQLAKENINKIDQLFAAPDAGGAVAPGQQLPPGHPAVASGRTAGPVDPNVPLPSGHPPIGGSPVQPAQPAAEGQPPAGTGPSEEQVRNVAEAMANTEMTPELKKSLDEAIGKGEQLLDEGKYQDARSALLPAMTMRPNDPRLAAALGGAMRGLGRAPMAERVLERALQLDPKQPRALYEMGLLLAARGDKAGAAQRLQALQQADPAFAKKHSVGTELAKLK